MRDSCPEDKTGWQIHNTRGSLVAGLAHGMGRKILCCRGWHEWPIDYQDMLREHGTAAELEQRVDQWVSAAIAPAADIAVLHRIGPGKGRIAGSSWGGSASNSALTRR